MFQFPGFALKTLCIQVLSTCFTPLLITRRLTITECQVGCPIRRFMDQSLFSAPHDLSQSITSFIASCCQGIHQTPFSRLIRSRKRETELPWPGLVRPGLLLNQKSLFPLSPSGLNLVVRILADRTGLVYLTWTTSVRFNRDTSDRAG